MPAFDRPVPKEYEWDCPDNPKHSPELRAEIEVMARLWRNREASWREEPWPTEHPPIPRTLWRRLFEYATTITLLRTPCSSKGYAGFATRIARTRAGALMTDAPNWPDWLSDAEQTIAQAVESPTTRLCSTLAVLKARCLLHLAEPWRDRVTIYTVRTGAEFPHMVEFIDRKLSAWDHPWSLWTSGPPLVTLGSRLSRTH